MSATGSENTLRGEAEGEVDFSFSQDLDKPHTTVWSDGPVFTYQSSGEWHMSFGSRESLQGEIGGEYPFYMYAPEEGEGKVEVEEEEEEEEIEEMYESFKKGRGKKKTEKPIGSQDLKSKSLFVHSFPSQFPDVTKTRKSAFGSIFLKTSSEVAEELVLLKTVADNSFILLCSMLDSFDKIIADSNTDPDRRRSTIYFKESLQKTLESHGISKTYSDGSVQWEIYPITQSYLFSVHLKDRIHQTRDLMKMVDRILEGPTKILKVPTSWPTKSIWSGYWDALGMSSTGIYSMPHGVSYFGKMQDGMFDDTNATLTYPNKFKALKCVFERGKLLSCQFQFPDMLVYEDDWKYCKFPDRRFWSEVQNGLKSAKVAQKTEIHPPRNIPPGCYDTGDGFYNPKSLMLESPRGKLLRVPVCEEDRWIKKYCRKGFFEHADFRPDLFENWFNYDQDIINSILNQQAAYRAGKITYSNLQQFYAELGLQPPFSPFKKGRTPQSEEFIKSIPEPKFLRRKHLEKFRGHKICGTIEETLARTSASKSTIEIPLASHEKVGVSKISFTSSKRKFEVSDSVSERGKRKIPEKYLKYQPLFKLPFQRPQWEVKKKKCVPRKSSSSSGSEILIPAEGSDDQMEEVEKKNMQKFMKNIILEVVTSFLKEERERHRQRFIWGQKVPKKKKEDVEKESLKILRELFDSIPDKDEFCDSDPKKTCDFKVFVKDKHNMLKYWGKRILLLDFDKKLRKLEKPEGPQLEFTADAHAELLFASFLKKDK